MEPFDYEAMSQAEKNQLAEDIIAKILSLNDHLIRSDIAKVCFQLPQRNECIDNSEGSAERQGTVPPDTQGRARRSNTAGRALEVFGGGPGGPRARRDTAPTAAATFSETVSADKVGKAATNVNSAIASGSFSIPVTINGPHHRTIEHFAAAPFVSSEGVSGVGVI